MTDEELFKKADAVRREVFGIKVYIRGLIEVSNYCKNNCFYCGIRGENRAAARYRLSKEQILACCAQGYELGFRTFVFQGGEDGGFTDGQMCDIISAVKNKCGGAAVTLSLGEKTREVYKAFRDAGADRYLLRHEAADEAYYKKVHPAGMSLENRKRCLWDLKELGYKIGTGFMVGLPGQTDEHLREDFRFMKELEPDMIGIGPFLAHRDTPYAKEHNGDLYKTLRVVAWARILFPHALIPATTALITLHPNGRALGLKAGANVVMPNLSPVETRKLYELYDNKAATGAESAEGFAKLKREVAAAGYEIVSAVGHAKGRGQFR